MFSRTKAVILAAAIVLPQLASAQQINSRAQLQSILTTSTVEDFEAIPLGFGNAAWLNVTTLDANANTVFGTGMVGPNASFTSAVNIQVSGPGYFGFSSNAILSGSGPLGIYFTNFTTAFGFDAFDFSGYAQPYSVDVFDVNNVALGSMSFSGSDAPNSEFVGWQNAGGIGYVNVNTSRNSWTPSIDNVEFGTATVATPEPASMALLATGLIGVFGVVRRRKR